MLQSRKAESFVGIMVWIFILSFVILGIVNILVFSSSVTIKYNEANRIYILKQNLTNIIREMDTSHLKENEIFYVHKNRVSRSYEIYTGSTNEHYKYIDELGNTIDDVGNYDGDVYSQVLWLATEDITFLGQNQVIRASIKKLVKN